MLGEATELQWNAGTLQTRMRGASNKKVPVFPNRNRAGRHGELIFQALGHPGDGRFAQNWNRTQYVTEASNKQRAIVAERQHSNIRAQPFASIAYTSNQEGLGTDQQQLERTVKFLLEMIVKQCDALESSLCAANAEAARQQRSVP